MIQWLALILLIAGIIVLLMLIARKMHWKGRYGATRLPSSSQQTMGGTIMAKPAGLEPKAAGGASTAVHVTDPAKIFGANDAKLAIIMFHAAWCGHCKALKPIFEEIAMQHPDVDFKLVEDDVRQKSPEAKQLDIPGFPAVLAMKGKKQMGKMMGNQGAEKLQEFVKKMKAA